MPIHWAAWAASRAQKHPLPPIPCPHYHDPCPVLPNQVSTVCSWSVVFPLYKVVVRLCPCNLCSWIWRWMILLWAHPWKHWRLGEIVVLAINVIQSLFEVDQDGGVLLSILIFTINMVAPVGCTCFVINNEFCCCDQNISIDSYLAHHSNWSLTFSEYLFFLDPRIPVGKKRLRKPVWQLLVNCCK